MHLGKLITDYITRGESSRQYQGEGWKSVESEEDVEQIIIKMYIKHILEASCGQTRGGRVSGYMRCTSPPGSPPDI